MPKKHHISGPISQFKVKPLDEELFFQLFDILHDGCMGGNVSATARILDVHANTVKKWMITPPKNKWINHILHSAISDIYQSMIHSKHKKIRKRAANVAGQLARSDLHSLKDYIEFNEANNSDVQRALLVEINEAPSQQLTLSQLRKPAHLGAYNVRKIREAAVQLNLIREVTGFGDDKDVLYRMPTSADL